jgi:hypothetical protein
VYSISPLVFRRAYYEWELPCDKKGNSRIKGILRTAGCCGFSQMIQGESPSYHYKDLFLIQLTARSCGRIGSLWNKNIYKCQDNIARRNRDVQQQPYSSIRTRLYFAHVYLEIPELLWRNLGCHRPLSELHVGTTSKKLILEILSTTRTPRAARASIFLL